MVGGVGWGGGGGGWGWVRGCEKKKPQRKVGLRRGLEIDLKTAFYGILR